MGTFDSLQLCEEETSCTVISRESNGQTYTMYGHYIFSGIRAFSTCVASLALAGQ